MKVHKPDMAYIRRYLNGELTPREMHVLERQAQDDPLLMDVILGMEAADPQLHDTNIQDIRQRINARIGQGNTKRLAPFWRWSVAATVLTAIGVGTLWLVRQPQESAMEISQTAPTPETPKRVQENPPERSVAEMQSSEGQASVATEQQALTSSPPPADTAPRLAMRAEEQAQITDTSSHMDSLDEVVVVGYGVQKKPELTGAVAKLDPSQRDTGAAPQALQTSEALVGRVPGIRIRGVSSMAKADKLTGKVINSETQEPLSDVVLQLANNRTVITDSSGEFAITDPTSILDAKLLGYQLKTVNIATKDSIVFVMEPAKDILSEVVVVGYGKEKNAMKPEPEIGWKAYNRYLKKEARIAGQKGVVELAFTLDAEGRPINIRVVKSTNETLGRHAIKLVEQGSHWKSGDSSKKEITLKIRFR